MNSKGGRDNVVPDEDILAQLVGDDPMYSSAEVAEDIQISKMGTYKRLKKLRDRDLVASKKIGQGLGWWLTDAGREYLAEAGVLDESEDEN